MNTEHLLLITVALATIFFTASAIAEEASGTPQPFAATVQKIEGTVDAKLPEAAEWHEAKQGESLPEGSEIFTGNNSFAEISFEDSSTITIQSLTHVKIDKALREKAEAETKVATTVTVDIGEVGVEVKETSVKTDFKVRTPDFTISIRGSQLDAVWVHEIGSAAAMRIHTADVFDNQRPDQSIAISPGEATDSSLTQPLVLGLGGRRISLLPGGVTLGERNFKSNMLFASDTIPTDLSGRGGRPAKPPFQPPGPNVPSLPPAALLPLIPDPDPLPPQH